VRAPLHHFALHTHSPRRSIGHEGRHGHEWLEFEYNRGRLRYANNSNYRNESLLRKESESARTDGA
jgi:hypothetical protein